MASLIIATPQLEPLPSLYRYAELSQGARRLAREIGALADDRLRGGRVIGWGK